MRHAWPPNTCHAGVRVAHQNELQICTGFIASACIFIRDFTHTGSIASKTAVDPPNPGYIVVLSDAGYRASLASKYRSACPIVVVTSNGAVVKHINVLYAQYLYQLSAPATPDHRIHST